MSYSALATIFMPWLVLAMASGFAGDARLDMAVIFGRIVFVYIVFISLAALVSGVLNASGRFAAAAAAPVLLNIILITILILAEAGMFGSFVGEAQGARHGSAMAVGVVLAGMAQLALVWIAARRAGFNLTPTRPRLSPEIKRLAIIAAPAMLAGGVVQINLLIGRQVASYFDGAIVWLSFADRLYQLPLGVVGIAIGIVLLPDLSRRLAAEDTTGGQHALSRAAEMSLALAIPAAVALLVIPGALVAALFERGAFTPADTTATAWACAVYGLGLPYRADDVRAAFAPGRASLPCRSGDRAIGCPRPDGARVRSRRDRDSARAGIPSRASFRATPCRGGRRGRRIGRGPRRERVRARASAAAARDGGRPADWDSARCGTRVARDRGECARRCNTPRECASVG